MFKVEVLVEDKKLHKVMRLLDGNCYDLKAVPMRDAQLQNGKVRSTAQEGTLIARVIALLPKAGKSITSKELKQMILAAGGVPQAAYSYVSTTLKDAGHLKKKSQGLFTNLEAKS